MVLFVSAKAGLATLRNAFFYPGCCRLKVSFWVSRADLSCHLSLSQRVFGEVLRTRTDW